MAASRMIAAGIADQVEWPVVRGIIARRPSQTVELDRDSLKQANDDACHDRAKDDEFGLKRHCNLPCLILRSGPRR
jgi:hypothetical protein